MNPVVVIPTYWCKSEGQEGAYDHATPLDKPRPELETCLSSLEGVRGVMRVVVLLVAPPACEDGARARVNAVCASHPRLNPLVIGHPEAVLVRGATSAISPGMAGETVSLRGYGAIRNMGLAVAAVLGHDVVVFMDDDEVALDPEFLVDGVYGLGRMTRQDLPILAKSGYFIDRSDSPLADESHAAWQDKAWTKRSEFNAWMRRALSSTRISRSNYVCGGCMAIHAEAFTRVAFDPWITRGEDLDYLFDLRMNGLDVWFDNAWRVRHMPPPSASAPARFLQDVYRWVYESRKLEDAGGRIGLHKVTPESLMPYPGPWIAPSVRKRISRTARARAFAEPEHGAYLDIWIHGLKEADHYADEVGTSYLSFQSFWPRLMESLWDDKALAERLLGMGTPAGRGSSTGEGTAR
ncbi:MAG: glycosyltransferase family 2 protein [Atopobiaceae bacterium]|nr:glycosyltransferase family 2 protein [Atopobiaceae bacterium]MCI2173727.1 glycosyltransferase family 2 protein [Atopobiaceae bacterium]MCI2207631.1 glycosyltransferase family 2 protein [Atopobiaceae bacterium]